MRHRVGHGGHVVHHEVVPGESVAKAVAHDVFRRRHLGMHRVRRERSRNEQASEPAHNEGEARGGERNSHEAKYRPHIAQLSQANCHGAIRVKKLQILCNLFYQSFVPLNRRTVAHL